ncbi:MAG: hypothetical protein ABEJ42_07950 [Halobacteriaceae archaeon]
MHPRTRRDFVRAGVVALPVLGGCAGTRAAPSEKDPCYVPIRLENRYQSETAFHLKLQTATSGGGYRVERSRSVSVSADASKTLAEYITGSVDRVVAEVSGASASVTLDPPRDLFLIASPSGGLAFYEASAWPGGGTCEGDE